MNITRKIKILINNYLKFHLFYHETKFLGDNFIYNKKWKLSQNIESGNKIIIYGFGPYGQESFVKFFGEYYIAGIYDLKYKELGNFIESPDNIVNGKFDYVLITVMSNKVRNSVIDFLLSKGVTREKILYIINC